MTMREKIEATLDPFRPGIAADGGELVLEDIEAGGCIRLKVSLGPEACGECLLPSEQMAEMFVVALRPVVGASCSVKVSFEQKR